MKDDTVTLRDRDTLEQTRVPIEGLAEALSRTPGSALEQPEAGLIEANRLPQTAVNFA